MAVDAVSGLKTFQMPNLSTGTITIEKGLKCGVDDETTLLRGWGPNGRRTIAR